MLTLKLLLPLFMTEIVDGLKVKAVALAPAIAIAAGGAALFILLALKPIGPGVVENAGVRFAFDRLRRLGEPG